MPQLFNDKHTDTEKEKNKKEVMSGVKIGQVEKLVFTIHV